MLVYLIVWKPINIIKQRIILAIITILIPLSIYLFLTRRPTPNPRFSQGEIRKNK